MRKSQIYLCVCEYEYENYISIKRSTYLQMRIILIYIGELESECQPLLPLPQQSGIPPPTRLTLSMPRHNPYIILVIAHFYTPSQF